MGFGVARSYLLLLPSPEETAVSGTSLKSSDAATPPQASVARTRTPIFERVPFIQSLLSAKARHLQQRFGPPDFLGGGVGVDGRLMKDVMLQQTGTVEAVTCQ